MRFLDRLGLSQRIVLVIALALFLGAVGIYLVTLGTPTAYLGGFGYTPLRPGINIIRGPDLPTWAQLLVWMGLILVWTVASVVVLRPAETTSSDADVAE